MTHSFVRARSGGAPETLMTHSSARARSGGAPETQTNHIRTVKTEESNKGGANQVLSVL